MQTDTPPEVNKSTIIKNTAVESPSFSIEHQFELFRPKDRALRLNEKRLKAIGKTKFVPFFHERDHLGRLLKPIPEKNDPLQSPDHSKSILSPSNSISEKPLNLKYSYNADSLKMFGDHLNWDELQDKYKDQPSIKPNNMSSHLFSILPVEEGSFIVSPSHRLSQESLTKPEIKKATSTDFKKNPLSQLLSVATTPRSTLQPSVIGKKLPAIHGSMSVSSYTKKDIDFPQDYSQENHLANETVWKYQMTQDEVNKKIQKPESFWKNKSKSNHARLTKPKRTEVPSIGLYQPHFETRKRSPTHKFSTVMKKTHLSRSPLKDDSYLGSFLTSIEEAKPRDPREETLKMIRDMLADADRVARAKQREDENKAYNSIIPLYKKLSYVTVNSFERFPEDFGQKMGQLRNKIRLLKNNIHDGNLIFHT